MVKNVSRYCCDSFFFAHVCFLFLQKSPPVFKRHPPQVVCTGVGCVHVRVCTGVGCVHVWVCTGVGCVHVRVCTGMGCVHVRVCTGVGCVHVRVCTGVLCVCNIPMYEYDSVYM